MSRSIMWARYRCSRQTAITSAARGFVRVAGRRYALHHAPDLDPFEVALFRRACDEAVGETERVFGRRLRRWRLYPGRLTVYLFASDEEVGRVFGRPAGGFASWAGWYVAVNIAGEWREHLRHELAHIFAWSWNPTPPRVMEEGLAVWAQRTSGRRPVDECARRTGLGPRAALDLLLGPEPADRPLAWNRYYLMAGSFTGFVIRRFGWAAYRGFYGDRSVARETLPRAFVRHFGMSMTDAVAVWFNDLWRRPVGPVVMDTSL